MSVNRNENGRNKKGQFTKGNAGGGRKPLPDDFKLAAKEYSTDALKTLFEIYTDINQQASARVSAIKLILAYGYGNPTDTINMSHSTGGDFVIEIGAPSELTED